MKSVLQRVRLLPFFLLPLLVACGSSSDNTQTTDDDRRLVHIDAAAVAPTIKPHQTVVISRAAVAEDGDSGYQELPYEILNTGSYKFCVPEDDSHIDRVELLDTAAKEVGRWVKGVECLPVRLHPGTYTLHIHHAIDEYDSLLFIKPQAVTPIPVATAAQGVSKAAIYNNNIPDHQFVDNFRHSLWEVVRHNTARGILYPNWREGWGLTAEYDNGITTWDDLKGYLQFDLTCGGMIPRWQGCESLLKDSPTYDNNLGKFIISEVISVDPVTTKQFVLIENQNQALARHTSSVPGASNIYVLGPWGSLDPGQEPDSKLFWLGTQQDYSGFFLSKYPSPWGYGAIIYKGAGTSSLPHFLAEGTLNDSYAVNFHPKVRTGIASGTDLPVVMIGDIALFDQCYGKNGFSEPANYWIFHEKKIDFSDIGSPPVANVHSVMVAPGLTATLYSQPSMQGEVEWVSGPNDKAMIMTCTDSSLLNNGNIQSTYFDSAANNITSAEFEHHMIVAASTCVGCDLHGFTFTPGLQLANVNFMFSDLTNAKFSALTITGKGNFFNAQLNGADLSSMSCPNCAFKSTRMENAKLLKANLPNAEFHDSRLHNADFTGAKLQGAVFVDALLEGTKFQGADLSGASLLNTTWTSTSGFKFDQTTKLARVNFGGSNLHKINLGGFDLNSSLWKAGSFTTRGGVKIDYGAATLIQAYLFNTNLKGADLSGADLSYASWFGEQATGEDAVCEGTKFEFADMPGITLTKASLREANFTDATLVGAKLNLVTSLVDATFLRADLRGVDLTGTSLVNATLYGATVSKSPGTATLQVLIDPATKADAYSFFHQNYLTTLFANTAGVKNCPSGSRIDVNTGCGPVTVDVSGKLTGYWLPPENPTAPTNCTTDGAGTLNCTKKGR